MRYSSRCLLILLAAILAAGCSSLDYYAQSVRGQFALIMQSRSIESIIDDADVDPALKAWLSRVLEIRAFATEHLALPDNKSYTRYADIGRPYVVWNVFAAPELSLEPRQWCFPIAGCVVYRGYFTPEAAQRFADQLQVQGDDVYVAGISAYSTLGWFNDPVLSTMLNYEDAQLAGLIFHELAHQVLYIKDDTVFNESFATVVELEGMMRWSKRNGDSVISYLDTKALEERIVNLVLEYRARLQAVYAANDSDVEKRERKREIFSALRAAYQRLPERFAHAGYDDWFAQDLNNAHLVSIGAYHELVEALQAELAAVGGDLQRFYSRVRRIADLDPVTRRAQLLLTPAP
ncbi:MAG: aminopeptidase [Gammaproteobacteria bacterium]|nr:aminopeptidase [Gammaproteobacteria bacterium]MDH3464296.1 aminopeptidase [Gammaproteobacteria bacterium]